MDYVCLALCSEVSKSVLLCLYFKNDMMSRGPRVPLTAVHSRQMSFFWPVLALYFLTN